MKACWEWRHSWLILMIFTRRSWLVALYAPSTLLRGKITWYTVDYRAGGSHSLHGSNGNERNLEPRFIIHSTDIFQTHSRLVIILYGNFVPLNVSGYFLNMGVILNLKLFHIEAKREIRTLRLTFFLPATSLQSLFSLN
jgi:hypothetical protein